jgi:hypothetical protein
LQEQKALGVPFVLAWDRALRELGSEAKHWHDPLMATRASWKRAYDGAGEGPQSSD